MEPAIPSAGRDLWTIFWELKVEESITWTEVYNYCWFNEIELDPNEVQIIMAMNGEYNKYIQEVETPKQSNQTPKTKGK